MAFLKRQKVSKKVNGRNMTIGFNSYGNKHLYSDTFRRSKTFQKGDLLNVHELLKQSQYIKDAKLSKTRKDGIRKFYYFKVSLHGNEVYLNVAEERKMRKGKMTNVRYLYSVTDKIQ